MDRSGRRCVFMLGSVVLVAACGGGGGGGTDGPGTSGGTVDTRVFSLHTNATDPLFLSVSTEDGSTHDYFGARDGTGTPTDVQAVVVTAPDGETHRLDLDDVDRPRDVVASNGSTFHFDWTGPAQATVTVTSPSGESQVTTQVNFPGSGVTKASSYAPAYYASGGSGQVFVNVTDCGGTPNTSTPYQVDVSVFNVSSGELVGVYPAYRSGDGSYCTSVPVGQTEMTRSRSACESIAGVLGNACTVIEALGPNAAMTICSAISVAIDVLTIPSGEAALMIAGCAAAMPVLETYCQTLGASPAQGAPSLADALCSAIPVNSYAAELRLVAHVNTLPASPAGAPVTVSSDAPFPITLTVDAGGRPTIRTFVLNPSNPGAGQGYVGTASLFCIPGGSTVKISIVGTDGYSDSVTYNVSSPTREGTYTLSVPGAQQGVQDTVTIEFITPSDGTFERIAYLVFS